MANYVQTNNSVSAAYQNFFLSKVPEGKDYIIFSSEDYYNCVYGSYDGSRFNDSTLIRISRSYGSQGVVSYIDESSTSVSIGYEYYSYSNVGIGTLLTSPDVYNKQLIHDSIQTILLFTILLVTIGFNIIRKRWIDN